MKASTEAPLRKAALSGAAGAWLFGYGSLLYKVDFPVLEWRRAAVRGWARRFWQGSHDHRGTPRHPGRVVTLVPEAASECIGVAYRIAPAAFRQLDFREKNGYLRQAVTLDFGRSRTAAGIAYVAPAGNAAWLGPASDDDIARHVASASGPSGRNSDYVLRLAAALRALGATDPHVFAVEARLRDLLAGR